MPVSLSIGFSLPRFLARAPVLHNACQLVCDAQHQPHCMEREGALCNFGSDSRTPRPKDMCNKHINIPWIRRLGMNTKVQHMLSLLGISRLSGRCSRPLCFSFLGNQLSSTAALIVTRKSSEIRMMIGAWPLVFVSSGYCAGVSRWSLPRLQEALPLQPECPLCWLWIIISSPAQAR